MATLLPNGRQQFIDGNGDPLAGGFVHFYVPNTLTPKDTWQDSGQATLNTNPVELDASGEAVIYGSGSYRQIVTDIDGNPIWDQLTADTAVGGIVFGGVSTGTANAQNIAASTFSQQDGQQVQFFVGTGLTNTGPLTIALGGGSPIALLKDTTSGPTPLTGGEVAEGNAVTMIYSVSRGAFHLVQNDFDPVNIPLQQSTPVNFALKVDVNSPGANQLTISIKNLDGTDPSTLAPVYVPFRNATATSGIPAQLKLTAATSFTLSSGSTLGTSSGIAGRIWAVLFNDGGTARIGLVNLLSSTANWVSALRDGINSATAEGGGGGADTNQVIYASTAVSSQPMTIIGYFNITEATAGNWSTAPSYVEVFHQGIPLPGSIVQNPRTDLGTVATGTTRIPFDNTIPQITEGDQYMTQAITPLASPNLLRVTAQIIISSSTSAASNAVALFQDSTANALKTVEQDQASAAEVYTVTMSYVARALSTSPTTFRIRAATNAGTLTFNGSAGGGLYGGTLNSFMQVEEIMS